MYLTPDRPIEIEEKLKGVNSNRSNSSPKTSSLVSLEEFLKSIQNENQRTLLEDIRESVLEISGDIHEKIFKSYTSYRTSINFCDLQPLINGDIAIQIPNNLIPEKGFDSFKIKKGKSWSSFKITNKDNLKESLLDYIENHTLNLRALLSFNFNLMSLRVFESVSDLITVVSKGILCLEDFLFIGE